MDSVTLTVKMKNRLKAIMADEGFRSMRALASETGISQNMLYMFERGESALSADNIIRLLWRLHCKFEDLIQYEVESDEPNHWDDLSDEVKEAHAQALKDREDRKKAKEALERKTALKPKSTKKIKKTA